ncbi:MAG: hypothetical protein Kow0080_18680 [Candidatus Promineifilaceae bacterium]
MSIFLLDGSLRIKIFFEKSDNDYEDDICITIEEDCPDDEKLFIADETNIYITPKQARELALALNQAAEISEAENIRG